MNCLELFEKFQESTDLINPNENIFSHKLSVNLNSKKIIYSCDFKNVKFYDENIENYYNINTYLNENKKYFSGKVIISDHIYETINKNNIIIEKNIKISTIVKIKKV
jgi:hypothetical protein